MSRAWLALAASVLVAGCAVRPPHPDTFSFAVLGDMGYSAREEPMFVDTLRRIDAAAPAFVLHIGDFKGAGDCSDELYRQRRALLDSSAAPLVYTPGDNEWTDCRRKNMGSMDPIERLGRIREIFFAGRTSLGRRTIATEAQDACVSPPVAGCGCNAHPENRRWIHAGIEFVTLNIPGSNNNVGFDAASDAEARCRNAANHAWLEGAVAAAAQPAIRALVVVIHGNPWDAQEKFRHVYDGFLAQMAEAPARVGKPILFVHGDSHTYRVTPFDDARGNQVRGITRMETYGTPMIGWVKVTVDPGSPDFFGFEPKLVGLVPAF